MRKHSHRRWLAERYELPVSNCCRLLTMVTPMLVNDRRSTAFWQLSALNIFCSIIVFSFVRSWLRPSLRATYFNSALLLRINATLYCPISQIEKHTLHSCTCTAQYEQYILHQYTQRRLKYTKHCIAHNRSPKATLLCSYIIQHTRAMCR